MSCYVVTKRNVAFLSKMLYTARCQTMGSVMMAIDSRLGNVLHAQTRYYHNTLSQKTHLTMIPNSFVPILEFLHCLQYRYFVAPQNFIQCFIYNTFLTLQGLPHDRTEINILITKSIVQIHRISLNMPTVCELTQKNVTRCIAQPQDVMQRHWIMS